MVIDLENKGSRDWEWNTRKGRQEKRKKHCHTHTHTHTHTVTPQGMGKLYLYTINMQYTTVWKHPLHTIMLNHLLFKSLLGSHIGWKSDLGRESESEMKRERRRKGMGKLQSWYTCKRHSLVFAEKTERSDEAMWIVLTGHGYRTCTRCRNVRSPASTAKYY